MAADEILHEILKRIEVGNIQNSFDVNRLNAIDSDLSGDVNISRTFAEANYIG